MKTYPAFPSLAQAEHPDSTVTSYQAIGGMTLRDYFAAKAMQGMLADPSFEMDLMDALPGCAYILADAMLEARDQQ